MRTRNTKRWLAVFFCSVGWVYTGSAVAAEPATSAKPANEVKQGNLFTNAVANTPAPNQAATNGAAAAPAKPRAAARQPLNEDQPLPKGQTVNVGAFGQIDLHVKDLDLTKVLQLLSIQSHRNIIASKDVGGKVSADLYGVNFYDALDAILQANGYGYQEKGQFIYVYTADELAAMKKAQRKAITRVVHLNYITAQDASAFVSPLLSENGSIAVSGKTSTGFQPSVSDGGANSFALPDTLVIHDYKENVDQIMNVIESLDVRPKQVLVEATILQAQLTESNAFGVDLSVLVDYDFSDFLGTPINAVDKLIGGSVVGGGGTGGTGGGGTASNVSVANAIGTGGGMQTGVGNTSTAGGFKVGILTDNVAAFVRALDSVTDTTVLARPKLLVLNRQKANLLVGGRVGYLSTTATQTASTQTVEFLDVGTQLTLRPFVSNDDMIRLELHPSVNNATIRKDSNPPIPDETTQELTTNVIVRSGQTVILGGLFKEDTTVGHRQVPGLGDIPIIGNAFKGQDDSVGRDEVIFMIKPTIVKDKQLYAAADQAQNDVQLRVLGSRKGLLPWSRSKLTTAHVRNAMRDLNEGKMDKALWEVNLALYLDPTSVDAMKIKEKLTGQKFYYREHSILDNAIDQTIDQAMQKDKAAKPNGDVKDHTKDLTIDPMSDAAKPAPSKASPAPNVNKSASEHPQQQVQAPTPPLNESASEGAGNAQPPAKPKASTPTASASTDPAMEAAIKQAMDQFNARQQQARQPEATVNVLDEIQNYLPGDAANPAPNESPSKSPDEPASH